MTKSQLEQRLVVVILLLSLLGTITSFILQYSFHYEPCPLCIFQRLSVILSTLLALIIFFFALSKTVAAYMGHITTFISNRLWHCCSRQTDLFAKFTSSAIRLQSWS